MHDPSRPRPCVQASVAVLLLAGAGLLATASSSTSPPPPAQTPSQDAPGTTPGYPPGELEIHAEHQYRGPHPVHPDFGSGFCNEEGLHQEPYEPFEPELFVEVDGAWVFVGDPGDFDYEGPAYWYANPHPLPDEYGGDWCHYPWPHRHHFLLSGSEYDLIGGVAYFVGAFTDVFLRGMQRRRPFFRRHYRDRYLQGALYRRHRPRYARVGPNRYRRLHPRSPRGAESFRPFRPARRSVAGASGLTRRPGGRTAFRGTSGFRPRLNRQGSSGQEGYQHRQGLAGPAARGGLTRGQGMPVRDGARYNERRVPHQRRWGSGGPGSGHGQGSVGGSTRSGTRWGGLSRGGQGRGRGSGWNSGGSPSRGSGLAPRGHSRSGSSGSSARSGSSGRSGSSARSGFSGSSGRSGSSGSSGRSGGSGGSGRSGGSGGSRR